MRTQMTTPIRPPAAAGSGPPPVNPWLILTVCSTGLFLVGLDTTVVTVALPDITGDLGMSSSAGAWIVDAYVLMAGGLLIASGAFADRVGRRRVLMLGLTVFTVASVACALAPTGGLLIAARAVQGVGGSMLGPVGLAIVVGVFADPAARAKALGAWSGVFGLSTALGPLVGGPLVEVFGWRSVFWVCVPIALVALVAAWALVPDVRPASPRRIDGPGLVLLIAAITSVVALLIEGPSMTRGATAALAVGAIVATAVFVMRQRRVEDPLVDMRLFADRSFRGSMAMAVAVFAAFGASLLTATLYLQGARDLGPLPTALALLPMAVAAAVFAPVSGWTLARFGTALPIGVCGVLITGGGLLAVVGGTSDVWILSAALAAVGAGFGFANAPIAATTMASLPPERAGVAGGLASTSRQVGLALGTAVAGGVATSGSFVGSWWMVAAAGAAVLVIAI